MGEAPIEVARAAYTARHWDEARAAFEAVEAGGESLSADDLECLGTSQLLGGHGSFQALDRAFEQYEVEGRVHHAARVAIDLANAHAMRGEFGLTSGWIRQAHRVLEGASEDFGHAHLAGLTGFLCVIEGKINDALEHIERSLAIARRHGDSDAEALALNRRARVLMRLGRIDEARADLDEAMLNVHRGRVRPFPGAMIYCNTIDACRDMSDFERALEWTDAATAWINERQVWCFPGICQIHRAELLRFQGEHDRADQEAQAALALFERLGVRWGMGAAFAEVGNQRLEVGDLDAADDAYQAAQQEGDSGLPGAAVVRLRRGDAAGAHALLESGLEDRGENQLARAELLPPFVEACIEVGDVDRAREGADELAAIAERIGTVGLRASAQTAAARVHLAAGDLPAAMTSARAAKRGWNMVGARYQLLRARELLGVAYARAGDSVRAKLEEEAVSAARSALETRARRAAAAGSAGSAPTAEDTAVLSASAARSLSSATPIREGAVIDDKIEVGRVLGVGGMGVVHAGHHRITGRDVAIKVLKRRVCGDERECLRFLDEAKACGRIRHAHVVDIYDAGTWGEDPYIVMELLKGQSLAERLQERGRLEVAEALAIAAQTARGLAAAHAVGIVHRDLKPANIFVRDGGPGDDEAPFVKVLDFGLSRVESGGQTRSGELLGTPFYMAPEQIEAPTEVDARTDVHALGAVLFEMLAGRPPFVAGSVPALLLAITDSARPDLAEHRDAVPPAVVEIVDRALCREPDARFPSAGAFADAVEAARATV